MLRCLSENDVHTRQSSESPSNNNNKTASVSYLPWRYRWLTTPHNNNKASVRSVGVAMVSDASFDSICLILRFDLVHMSFFPSLTLSLFPFKQQVHHLGQAQYLARSSSAIGKCMHWSVLSLLLNPYSHNSLLSFCMTLALSFPPTSCFISLLPFLFLHYDCYFLLLLAFCFPSIHDSLLVYREYNINLLNIIINTIKISYWIVYRSIVLY